MNIPSLKTRVWTAAAFSFGLLLAGHTAVAAAPSSTTQSSPPPPMPGYGPGTMGPGMMYDWSPAQRQQHWEQMRQMGYGPGMMYSGTPEQRQQHWEQMRQMMGNGRGMMMGPMMGSRAGIPPETSAQ